MPNIVESIIDKVKTPDRVELSPADKQLLKKLIDSSAETRKEHKVFTETQRKETEEHLSAQLKALEELFTTHLQSSQDNFNTKLGEVLDNIKNLPELPAINTSLDTLKHAVLEQAEQGNNQLKTQMEDKHNALSTQLAALKSSAKDKEILDKLSSLSNQLSEMEARQNRQLRTVKIILGFTIWLSLLTLAVIAASVLGYI